MGSGSEISELSLILDKNRFKYIPSPVELPGVVITSFEVLVGVTASATVAVVGVVSSSDMLCLLNYHCKWIE
jgi:hypothetical protein